MEDLRNKRCNPFLPSLDKVDLNGRNTGPHIQIFENQLRLAGFDRPKERNVRAE